MVTAAILLLLLMTVMLLVLPRQFAPLPILLTIVLMTIGQEVVVGGLKFTVIRIIIIVGWLRLIVRREFGGTTKTPIDKALIYWIIATVLIGLIPKPIDPRAVMIHEYKGVVINKMGFIFDIAGSYYLARNLVQTTLDVRKFICALVFVTSILAVFMSVEKMTGRNMFSVFGAVPEITGVRDGRLRCQGPFTHPIHAGVFGAVFVPLSIGLWYSGNRTYGLAGIISGMTVTIESSSSGPLMALLSGVVAFPFWRYRSSMKTVRRGIVGFLLVVEVMMKSHVWWIMARVGDLVGGGGYWRAKLVDQFVFHFSEWWLIGTNYTAHWSPTGVGLPLYPDYMDLTNQFVSEGVSGGVVKFTLFIFLLVACFRKIGIVVNDEHQVAHTDRMIFWAIGCTLVAFIAAFSSVSMSAQTQPLFMILLALISATQTASVRHAVTTS